MMRYKMARKKPIPICAQMALGMLTLGLLAEVSF